MDLKGKKVLIGISGGIAAYKCPELVRQFIQAGAEVKVIATKNALEFTTEWTLMTLSRNKVYHQVFGPVGEWSPEHISHADWGDFLVVAPATANVIGKFASGIADDALSTTFLAFDKPVFIAPALNAHIYNHPIVQRNMTILGAGGVTFIAPASCALACGPGVKGSGE